MRGNIFRNCTAGWLRAGTEIVIRGWLAGYYSRWEYLFCPKLEALRKKLEQSGVAFPIYRKSCRLAAGNIETGGKIQAVFAYLRQGKTRTLNLPWLFPEEAWILPALDCKAFSVLMLEMLRAVGVSSQLWIGLLAQEHTGHAWLETEIKGEMLVYDREYPYAIPRKEYISAHQYSLAAQVI